MSVKLGIGIDTGGTFTDSVIVDLESGQVLSKAKALTTRQDLQIGIEASLARLNRSLFSRVGLVSLSTTLATNSVVEGKGSRVGLVVAVPNPETFRFPSDTPALEVALIAGAHDRRGETLVDLDVHAASEKVRRMAGIVDAFAVSSYFSIYNANHEEAIKELIAAVCSHPVVCGHELSQDLGLIERAVTACLNARLLPVIKDLLEAVKQTLLSNGITAPLMVVKGDGSLVVEGFARTVPVETVLSGPAASVLGACSLADIDNAVVVDMGGTTTDIAVVSDRVAASNPDGAVIGGWQTRVKAADLWTLGLGGDSKITLGTAGEITIGPRRAIPVCWAAHRYPQFSELLANLGEGRAVNGKAPGLDFFTLTKRPPFALTRHETSLIDRLDGTAVHTSRIYEEIGPFVSIERFVELGYVSEISLTPTDLLNATGALSLWDVHASVSAIAYLAAIAGIDRDALCGTILSELIESLKLNVAGKVLRLDCAPALAGSPEGRAVLGCLLKQNGDGELSASFRLRRPLIAVGAPAKAFFPKVASALGARFVIPEHFEVAGAVGAALGTVIDQARAYVRPDKPFGFLIVSEDEHKRFDILEEAIAFAEKHVVAIAEKRVSERGGSQIKTTLSREENSTPVSERWGGSHLIEIKVTARAVGKPATNYPAVSSGLSSSVPNPLTS